MLVVNARLSRTGYQTYATGREYRDAREVFSNESLATFPGAPIVVGHVEVGSLDASNVASVAVGYVRSAWKDGDHVGAELAITDAATAEQIKRGELVEISMGYRCRVEERPNGELEQVGIKIDHAALLGPGQGRCGSSCSIRRP